MVGVLHKMNTTSSVGSPMPGAPDGDGSVSRTWSGFSMTAPDDATEAAMPVSWAGSMSNLGAAGAVAAWRAGGAKVSTAGDDGARRREGAAGGGEPSGRPAGDGELGVAGGKTITVSSGQALKYIKAYGQLMK